MRGWENRATWQSGAAPVWTDKSDGRLELGADTTAASPLWTRPAQTGTTFAVLTGFLVPPVSSGYIFYLSCDGPCSFELEGVARAAHNGTHVTAGAGAGQEGMRVELVSGAHSFPLLAGQAYALRLSLQRDTAPASGASAGRLRLAWSWGAPASGTAADGGAVTTPRSIPADALYWGGAHVLGSPVPVWVGI
jgi:hypothetical protein